VNTIEISLYKTGKRLTIECMFHTETIKEVHGTENESVVD
jgi:hypothetical protein